MFNASDLTDVCGVGVWMDVHSVTKADDPSLVGCGSWTRPPDDRCGFVGAGHGLLMGPCLGPWIQAAPQFNGFSQYVMIANNPVVQLRSSLPIPWRPG